MFNFDVPKSPEREREVETKIILEFERHGKRERGVTPEEENNSDLRLTPIGRTQADEKGVRAHSQARVALGWGSSRTRTQETAYRTMLANEGVLDASDTFEMIEEKIAQHLHKGKKMKVDDRLGFSSDGPLAAEQDAAYYAGQYMQFVINKSDQRAIELNDTLTATYTRMAANVAEIILHHLQIGETFNRIAKNKDEYEKYGNQLERYLGTHMGISESFAAKAIGKIQGVEQKEKFLEAIGGGFAETEGIRIEILNKGVDQKIFMIYQINGSPERIELTKDVLEEIVKERGEFEKKF